MEEKTFKPVPDVECLKYHGTPEKPDIKIFVSNRIDLDSETIDNPLYIPVLLRLRCMTSGKTWICWGMIRGIIFRRNGIVSVN